MLQVAGLVIPLFGLVFFGYIAAKIKNIPIEALGWLNFFIVYIALPALFFNLLAKTPVSEFSNAPFLITTTAGTFITFFLCFLIGRFIRQNTTKESTIQGFAGAYGNIGYMGPPLALAAFGPEAGVPVALVFCLDNAMHFTLAPTLMAIGNKQRERVVTVVMDILRRIFTHPFILATIAGILAASFEFQPPAPLQQLLDSVAHAAAPCALFAMGVTAALRPLKRIPVELSYLIPVKLIIHPLLMYLLLTQFTNVEATWIYAAVLLAALPTATNVFVLAQQYQVWEERASSAVVISTLLSIVTVTVFLYFATNGYI